MCGIIGYVGKKDAAPLLVDGLSALEYRGYDSAGLFVEGQPIVKRAGKVAALRDALPRDFPGTLGMAHTRWATHGAPSKANAHPHEDATGTVILVHNGIIENYAELKEAQRARGIAFSSDTDTEVLVNQVALHYAEGVLLEDALAAALREVRGTYGVVAASRREPGKLVAARLGSPVMLGIGNGEYFIASDATPVLRHTREVVYLDDRDIAVLTNDGYAIRSLEGAARNASVETLEWDVDAAQKKGYEHFMLKEMMEIPEAIENTLRGRLVPGEGSARLGGLADILPELRKKECVVITGCGSASYAGRIGELLLEEFAGIPTEVELASELRYKRNTMDAEKTLLIAVSQSGETIDTLEAVREAKRNGITALGIVNVVGSSIARETDAGVYNHAGPEISVASTKAMISQMTVFAMLALLFGRTRGLAAPEGHAVVEELLALPEKARRILAEVARIEALAKKYAATENAFYLGRKYQFPIALEGAIKLKEISYIHAEAYPSGEMKHGPIALVEPSFLSIVLAPRDSLFEKSRSNLEEIRARGGKVIAVTTEDAEEELRGLADDVIAVPMANEALLPILTATALQLFAYFVAKERGLPIDQPRNLAKSVTVE